nr:hypothetical protein [uncultured Mediterranean phage uvMED]
MKGKNKMSKKWLRIGDGNVLKFNSKKDLKESIINYFLNCCNEEDIYFNGKTKYDYMSLDELLTLGKFECVKDDGNNCYH